MDDGTVRSDAPGARPPAPGDAGVVVRGPRLEPERTAGSHSRSVVAGLDAAAGRDATRARDAAAAAIAELVRSAAAGDQQAWAKLVDKFAGTVWAVARSHRLNPADSADVSQTTWLRLVEHLGRLEQPERVGAWLATTARRESLRVLRVAGRQVPTDAELDPPSGWDQMGADAQLIMEERNRTLHRMVEQLPVRCQVLLRFLVADSPLSYRQLSEVLDMPIGSLGPTRARCLEHLRRMASAADLSVSDLDLRTILG